MKKEAITQAIIDLRTGGAHEEVIAQFYKDLTKDTTMLRGHNTSESFKWDEGCDDYEYYKDRKNYKGRNDGPCTEEWWNCNEIEKKEKNDEVKPSKAKAPKKAIKEVVRKKAEWEKELEDREREVASREQKIKKMQKEITKKAEELTRISEALDGRRKLIKERMKKAEVIVGREEAKEAELNERQQRIEEHEAELEIELLSG